MRAIAWWVPILILFLGVSVPAVVPIKVAEAKIGNETINITTKDIMYKYVFGPVKHWIEKTLPTEATNVSLSKINTEMNKFENLVTRLLDLPIVKDNWQIVYNKLVQMNAELTNERVAYFVLCVYKGPAEVCRTYKLLETPGIERIANISLGNYFTIRLTYGNLVAINEHLENRDIRGIIEIVGKEYVRGDITSNVKVEEKVKEMVRERVRHGPYIP